MIFGFINLLCVTFFSDFGWSICSIDFSHSKGLKPVECVEIGEALVAEGITLMEVPLNSPDPFTSIGTMSTALSGRAMVGAGTVLTVKQVDAVAKAGGELIVSPNCNLDVIKHTKVRHIVGSPFFLSGPLAFCCDKFIAVILCAKYRL